MVSALDELGAGAEEPPFTPCRTRVLSAPAKLSIMVMLFDCNARDFGAPVRQFGLNEDAAPASVIVSLAKEVRFRPKLHDARVGDARVRLRAK